MGFDPQLATRVVTSPAHSAKAREPQVEPVMDAKSASVRRVASQESAIVEWVAASMNANLLFERGVRLRRQAESFVAWTTQMGERDAARTWGETQQQFAAEWRARHREAAAELKKGIEAEWPKNPLRIIETIFGKSYWRYPADDGITAAARKELGL
jgi:hypothetical protein